MRLDVVPMRLLAVLGMGVVLSGIALGLGGRTRGGKVTVAVFSVEPPGDEDVLAAELSSNRGVLRLLSMAGLSDEDALAVVGEAAASMKASGGRGVVSVRLAGLPDGVKVPDFLKAVERLLEETVAERREKETASLEKRRRDVSGRIEALSARLEKVEAEIRSILARFPGEFDDRFRPTGRAARELQELSLKMALLEKTVSGPVGKNQDASGRLASEEARLREELARLSESLGPLHPRIKALEKRLASLRTVRLVSLGTVAPAETRAGREEEARRTLVKTLSDRRKRLEEVVKALPAAAERLLSLSMEAERLRVELEEASRNFAALPESGPERKAALLGQWEEAAGERAGDVFPGETVAFLIFSLSVLGALLAGGTSGAVKSVPGKGAPLPRVLLDLSGEDDR